MSIFYFILNNTYKLRQSLLINNPDLKVVAIQNGFPIGSGMTKKSAKKKS